MRLTTFNLLHGLPILAGMPQGAMSGEGPSQPVFTDIGPLQDAVRALDADVIGLQEVDRHQPRSGGHDQTAVVAGAAGAAHWRFAASLHGTPGESDWKPADADDDVPADDSITGGPMYGVGLVSRLEVIDWRIERFAAAPMSIPLMVPAEPRPLVVKIADEPRAAVAAVLEGPHGLFSVATAHLSFVPGYNIKQLRALRAWVEPLPRPLFIIGDFNLPGALPRWVTGMRSLARGATYPVFRPKVQFDHILVEGLDPDIATRATVHSLGVSDHCALSVDVDW